MPNRLLSKSRYLYGLQCLKLLWIATNEPKRIPGPDAATQHIFDQGHEVGELAKQLFPGGVDVPWEDFKGNLVTTRELLRQRRPLFEAGVLAGKIYSRADILNPVNEREWDLVEVKSSASVKEVNLHDVSFQKLCWEEAGVSIRRCFLAHINNQYVRDGDIDPNGLFTVQDVSEEVAAASAGIYDRVGQMLDIIIGPSCPETPIGSHCKNPYECPLVECWDVLPEHHVFTLYYGGRKSQELYASGIVDIAAIPADYRLNDKQRIQCACIASGTPYADREALRQFLAGVEYPLYYLDFETFGTAIPLFDGVRPYQNVPFQFSLHVQEGPSAPVRHHEFLSEGRGDPRPGLLDHLARVIGTSGSVLAYNKSFEENVLRECGLSFPEHSMWIENAVGRLVDLIIPFRSFHYYHPSQMGSASLKKVLPAITGNGYDGMAIAKGDEASLEFLRITFDDASPEEVQKVRADLLAYCKMDTEGMVRIMARLYELAA